MRQHKQEICGEETKYKFKFIFFYMRQHKQEICGEETKYKFKFIFFLHETTQTRNLW